MSNENTEYLFDPSEFSGDSFSASSFVSKYQRVIELEELRHSLTSYKTAIDQQLSAIINEEYKDFIEISTKLDGVDSRVSLGMLQPLQRLQTEATVISEHVDSKYQTIRDLLISREKIRARQRELQRLKRCRHHVKSIRNCLHLYHNVVHDKIDKKQQETDMTRAKEELLLLQCVHVFQSEPTNDMWKLMQYYRDMEYVTNNIAQFLTEYDAVKGNATGEWDTMVECVLDAKQVLLRSLSSKLQLLFQQVIVQQISTVEGTLSVETECMIAHGVRALATLQSFDSVSQLLRKTMEELWLRSAVTQSTIDGSVEGGARGSYHGLRSHLYEKLVSICSGAGFRIILSAASFWDVQVLHKRGGDEGKEMETSYQVWWPIHLLVESVIHPLFDLIQLATHPAASAVSTYTMQSIAVPTTFHMCFQQTQWMFDQLEELLQSLRSLAMKDDASPPLISHPWIKSFQSDWKTSLYFHLRCQESRARLDALAGAVESEGWAVAVPFIGQGNDSNSSLKSALWSNTMPLPQLFAVVSSTASPRMLKLLIAVLIELEWTNHAQNALTALRKEYLGWQAVIVNRVMWWTLEGLYVDINTATSEFPWKTALQLTSESTMPTISSLPCGVLVTIQLTSSVSILDRLSQWTQVSGSARGKFAKWSPLSEMADASVSLLLATAWIWNEHLKSDRQDLKPFFLKQCRKWAMCIPLFWDRIVLRILHDVRGTMQSGIEQIPTQYRMTNKPMPLHHNSYIVSVCDNARKSWESVRENWLICVKDPLLKHFLSMDIPSELTDSLLADLLSTVPRALWSRLLEMFCGYAAKMLKTVREIDNRLSKRTGVSTRSGPATATDSDKILVQLWRDLHWVIKSAHESSDQAADTTLTNDLREQAQWAAQMLYPPLETLLSEFKDIERYVNTSS